MQSAEWASLRAATGWTVLQVVLDNRTIYAYRKKSPVGGIVYIPGFMPQSKQELQIISQHLKAGNLTCKVEACEPTDEKVIGWFKELDWKRTHNIQYEYTVRLDLDQSENDLWMGMKSRGRQEISYAKRDGVVIKEVDLTSENAEIMHHLLQDTSQRKSFGIREKQGVLKFWQTFADAGKLRLFFAYHKAKVIAGGVFITDSQHAWYKDAGSDPAYAKLFGPRFLLWEVALILKKDGYKLFDLGGMPGPEEYEHSPMKGIYIFKTAYSREVTTMMPAYEISFKPLLHPLWQKIEPTALKLNRKVSGLKGKLKR